MGLGLTFGGGDWMGLHFIGVSGLPEQRGAAEPFVVYQAGFAATTVTIVSAAIAGRAGFAAYATLAAAASVVIYPLFGHWAWGNDLLVDSPRGPADALLRRAAGAQVPKTWAMAPTGPTA